MNSLPARPSSGRLRSAIATSVARSSPNGSYLTRSARLQVLLVSVLCLMLAGTSSSWAYWVAKSSSAGAGSAVAGQLSIVPAAPTVIAGTDSVIVKWPLSIPVDAVSSAELTTKYLVKRYASSNGALQPNTSGCQGTIAGMGCTDLALPAGTWQYTITPRMGNNWLGVEGPRSNPVTLTGVSTSNSVYLWVTSN